MYKIKKGDYVTRISYNHDILFKVQRILKLSNGQQIAILRGVEIRIEADAPIQDLKLANKDIIKKYSSQLQEKISCFNNTNNEKEPRIKEKIHTGLILHLDGDKKYSEKSLKYYRQMGLNAIVRNVPENKQPKIVYKLLSYYKPDILIITGHDGMIKKQSGYNDIYNYRNSRHFIETVKEARRYDEENKKDLVIFAGACQSYFEAIISAGANFASSPARILIDFLDPLIVAKEIATTDEHKYITIDDFANELRDGKKGISGVGGKGKKSVLFI